MIIIVKILLLQKKLKLKELMITEQLKESAHLK